jgi:hypothetical protein
MGSNNPAVQLKGQIHYRFQIVNFSGIISGNLKTRTPQLAAERRYLLGAFRGGFPHLSYLFRRNGF